MTPRPFKCAAPSAELKNKVYCYENAEEPIAHELPIIVIKLPNSKHIVLSSGLVTLYDSLGATDVSTASSAESFCRLRVCMNY